MTENKYSTTGIKTDCEILLNEFVGTENVRYEDFVNIWNRMNFSFIYFGLKHQVDKITFIEEAFDTASTFLMLPYTFQVRIGALYLLYGLYFTQIQDPKIKIRISLNHWQQLVALHDDIHKQQHLDAEFIFLKLKIEKAFMVTATSKPMFYHRKFYRHLPESALHLQQPHSILAEFIDNDSLENLELLHNKYQYLKTTLKDAGKQSLRIVHESMSTFINSNIQEFLDEQSAVLRQNKEEADGDQNASDGEPSQVTVARDRATRIAKIKAKSFHGEILSPQHHASKQDLSSTSAQSCDNIPSKSTSKKSVKSRKKKTPKKLGRPKKVVEESNVKGKKGKQTAKKRGRKRKDSSIK